MGTKWFAGCTPRNEWLQLTIIVYISSQLWLANTDMTMIGSASSNTLMNVWLKRAKLAYKQHAYECIIKGIIWLLVVLFVCRNVVGDMVYKLFDCIFV